MSYSLNNKSIAAVILAAGKGTRMASDVPKPLVRLGGRPLIDWVLNVAGVLGIPSVVVESPERLISSSLGSRPGLSYVVQPSPDGPAGALSCGIEVLPEEVETVLVLLGDSPLTPVGSLEKLLDYHCSSKSDMTLLTGTSSKETPFSQIIRDDSDQVLRIELGKEVIHSEKTEYSLGPIVFKRSSLDDHLVQLIGEQSAEKRLEPMVDRFVRRGMKVSAVRVPVGSLVQWGINTPDELRDAEEHILL